MLRRKALTVLGFGGVSMLIGCNGNTLPALPVNVTLPTDLTRLISNVNAITSKVSSLFPLLPTSLQATAKTWLSKLQAAASSINVGKTVAAVQGVVSDFQTAWDNLQPLLSKASGTKVAGSSGTTSTIGTIISAVETVLPVVLKIAGVAVMFARRPRAAATVPMDYGTALSILRS